jgi:hypothetical protein
MEGGCENTEYSRGQEKRVSPPAWAGRLANISSSHKLNFLRNVTEPRTGADSLDKRHMQRELDMRFGTWNIPSLYRAGPVVTVSEELYFK